MQATLGRGFFLDEFAAIQRATGRPVTWTALLGGLFGPDGHRAVLEQSASLQRDGVTVVPQVACRPLNFEFQWKAPFPFESLQLFHPVSAADRAGKKRIYADPNFRRAFRERGARGGIAGRWEDTVISDCATEPALNERNVVEVAAERGVHPVDLVLDLGLATDLEARFRIAVMNTDEATVGELLTHPATVLGLSDAGAHASQLCDAPFATHLLSHWVRERGVLALEDAVALLTSRSADLFGITGRGRLAPGLAGDVTVFDPATVGCSELRRVRDLPAGADRLVADAKGVRAVVVNGVLLREDGRDAVDPDGPLPGHVVRGGRP
jgi:N-acyl-D-aspartate/D-glutamate deacylase